MPFFLAVLAMVGEVSALEFSRMQMKEYDNYTKLTCSYQMPKIDYAAPLYFDFVMRTNAGPSGTDTFQFSVPNEANRYVEFGPNGTKIILRKTTKGIWKIALVRNFDSPEGQVTCDGNIWESQDTSLASLSDFKKLVGYFDRETFHYETERTEYGEYGYCRINGVDCYVSAEFTYTYRHDQPLRTLWSPDNDYCDREWGCGDAVATEGIENLVALRAKVEVDDIGVFEFTLEDATLFRTWEVLDYAEPEDANDYADKEIKAIDSATGYSMRIDNCDADFTSCIQVDLSDDDYVSVGTRLTGRGPNGRVP